MENEDKKYIFCSDCGAKNSAITLYCSNCGKQIVSNKQNIEYEKSNNTLNNVNSNPKSYSSTDDIMKFVSQNIYFYQEKFNLINKTGKKITWNWAAFFLSIYWMLYRKMYLQTGGIFLLSIILTCIPYVGYLLSLSLGIIICIILGMYGNYMYLNHIERKLKEIDYLNNYERDAVISRKGGVNLVLPIVIAIIPIALIFIMFMFVGTVFNFMLY